MYDFSIPVLTRGLTNMSAILDKAAAHADGEEIRFRRARAGALVSRTCIRSRVRCKSPATPPRARRARLAGIEVPKHEDTETTLPSSRQRIAKTAGFPEDASTRRKLKDAESRSIEIKFPNGTLEIHRARAT